MINLKDVLVICLVLFVFSMSAVSANDLSNTPVNESSSVSNSYLVSDIQNSTNPVINSPGSFDDLQVQINNACEGSVLFLNRDYNGCENSRIMLNKNLTIDGQGHTVDCLNKKNCFVFYSQTGQITLKNLIISNSRNYYADMGGAIYITGSAQYDIVNCTFSKNLADARGGAIFNNATNPLSITDSRFINNNVFDDCGGAIYSKSIVNIKDSVFDSNSAVIGGGAIYCENDINIIGCLFEKNFCESMDSCGGAIRSITTITVNNSTFKNNRVEKSGGALYSHCIKMSNSSYFENNNACNGDGGAIYIVSDINGGLFKFLHVYTICSEIDDAVFINNTAFNKGGAIYSEVKLNITNSSFKSNSVEVQGGAVYSEVLLNVEYCEFELNRVSSLFKESYGGAIFANSVGCSFSIFIDNQAKKAGAIYATYLWADNSIFKKNHANDYGGAIHSDLAILVSSDFVNNTADYGGAIYSEGTIINASSFENNTAVFGGAVDSQSVVVSASYFNKNFANYGGAVFANESDKSINSGCEFKDTLFINNVGRYGGAFYVDRKVKSVFSQCNFTNNTSFTDGGAVYMQRNNEASFSQCVFTKNSALNSKGGAIYNQYGELGNDKLSIFRDTFLLSVENCTFKGNYAKESGGAIFWTGCLVLKPFSYFDSNIADTGCGGAIYTEMFAYKIQNITFVNNIAGNDGGAINVNRLTEDIKYSNFITNHAEYGGAIYINDLYQDSTFSHCTFIHNTGKSKPDSYIGGNDVAILVGNNEYPNPNLEHSIWDDIYQRREFLNTYLSISDCNFFDNIAASYYLCGAFIDYEKEVWDMGFRTVKYLTDQFKNPNPIKMNLVCNNEEVIIGKPIKVTFYLYNGADGSLYRGDGFDMNNASFDIDPSIKVVNKEFDKNSVTLELIPQKAGHCSFNVKVNFYGCSLSKTFDVSRIDLVASEITAYYDVSDEFKWHLDGDKKYIANQNVTVWMDSRVYEFFSDDNGDVSFYLNDDYVLDIGTHDVLIKVQDFYYRSTITILPNITILAPEISVYYSNPVIFKVHLDGDKRFAVNQSVRVSLGFNVYEGCTDENGDACVYLPPYASSSYPVSVDVLNVGVKSEVNILSTIDAGDIVRSYGDYTPFSAVFKDSSGKYLPDCAVVQYAIDDSDLMFMNVRGNGGQVLFNIACLNPGDHVITLLNFETKEVNEFLITILPGVDGN